MSSIMRKVCAGVVSTAFAGGMLLGVAAPAQATTGDCLRFLDLRHHDVWGEKKHEFEDACRAGERKFWHDCVWSLDHLRVDLRDASEACDRAQWHKHHDHHDHHGHHHR